MFGSAKRRKREKREERREERERKREEKERAGGLDRDVRHGIISSVVDDFLDSPDPDIGESLEDAALMLGATAIPKLIDKFGKWMEKND